MNNFDVGDCCGGDATNSNSHGAQTQTPKSRRIECLERQLLFYRGKVRDIESSITAAVLESPPNTPCLQTSKHQSADGSPQSIDSIATSTNLVTLGKLYLP